MSVKSNLAWMVYDGYTTKIAEAVSFENHIVIDGYTINLSGGISQGQFIQFDNTSLVPSNTLISPAINGIITTTGLTMPTFDMNGGIITGLGTSGTGPNDVATRAYVDSAAAGLSIKDAAIVLATSNITLNGHPTIDSVSVVDGYRVLLNGQTNQIQNGLWVVHSGSWTRPIDFADGYHASGSFVFIQNGTVNAGTGWVCGTSSPNDIIGSNNLTFSQFSSAGNIAVGDGLSKVGNTISNAGVISLTSGGGIVVDNTTGDITFSSSIGGDLTGSLSSAIVAGLQGHAISTTPPTDKQALIWNNGANQWQPSKLFYQIIQSNTTPQNQRGILNFSSVFTVADNSGADRTLIGIADGAISNSMLVNNSITINDGIGITGGNTVALGDSLTLDLSISGVSAGSYTNTNLTVDAYGRITTASNGSAGGVSSLIAQNGITGNVATGDVVIELTTTGVSANTYGSSTQIGTFEVDAYGRLSSASNTSIQIAESQVTNLTTDLANKVPTSRSINAISGQLIGSGDLSTDITLGLAAIGTASTFNFGNGNISTDSYGRVSSGSSASNLITQAYSTIQNNGVGVAQESVLNLSPRLLATDVSSKTLIDLATSGVIASSYGSATQVSSITVDAYGRLTSAANTSIQIAESQVTNLTTDLSGKVPTTRGVNTTSRLTGGGALSTDLTIDLSTSGITANTYQGITFDAYGRATSASNQGYGTGSVTSIATTSRLTGGIITTTGTLDLATSGVSANTYGSATQVSTITLDAYGRATSASNTSIQITETQVTNLTTDLSGKAATTTTISTTAPLTGGGNLSANRTFAIPQAATTTDGYLGQTDWNTFNNKVGTARNIATTSPIIGGGNLSADRTISIPKATTSVDGYLSAVDWTTFNNKGSVSSIATTSRLTGGTITTTGTLDLAVSGVTAATYNYGNGSIVFDAYGRATSATSASNIITQAYTTAQNNGSGVTQRSTFNHTVRFSVADNAGNTRTDIDLAISGVSANSYSIGNGSFTFDAYGRTTSATAPTNLALSTTAISTTAPLSGGGDLSNNRTLSIPKAGISTDGYLSQADWNTFNGKGLGSVTSIVVSSPLTGGTITTTGTITIPKATSSQDGYLAQGDWTIFNNKGSVSSVATNSSLTGGQITTTGTLGINLSNTNTWIAKQTFSGHIAVDGYTLDISAGAVTGQALVYNGSNFVATTLGGGTGTVTSIATTSRLTGGPISTSGTLDLATSGVSAATYNYGNGSIAFDAYGRATSAASASNLTLTTTTISTTAPLTGGGDLSANRTISIPKAATSTDGYLSQADWNTFNNKGSGSVTSIVVSSPLTGGTITTTGTVAIPKATASQDGYLAQGDWTIFNNKGSGTVTSVATTSRLTGGTITTSGTLDLATSGVSATAYAFANGSITFDAYGRATSAISASNIALTTTAISTTAPLSGGGDLSTNRTLSIPKSGTSTDGYLSQADWNTFNNKGSVSSVSTTSRLTGGTITTTGTLDLATSGVSANSYAFANGSITFDAYGRATSATAASNIVTQAYSTIKNNTSSLTQRSVLNFTPRFLAADDTTDGYTYVDLATSGVSANTYGSATQVSTITLDAYGRATSASNTSIQIAESQVTNLTTDLAAKALTSTTISTTAPLSGGGSLAANRTLSIPQAATTTDGYLGQTDWNTFNNKVATTRSIATTAPLTGGGDLSANRTLSIPKAATSTDGYLSQADWNTFNSKGSGSVTSIVVSSPLTGGTISTTGTIAIPKATASQDGYLAQGDWTTFNSKGVGTVTSIIASTGITGGTITSTGTIAVDQSFSPTWSGTQIFSGTATFNDAVMKIQNAAGTFATTFSTNASAARTWTFPDASATAVGQNNTQTLTNKTLSGSSNTFTNIGNSSLTNNTVGVSTAARLTGGSTISLGSSTTLDLATSGVSAGSYTSANITVDAYGRLTSASNGGGGLTFPIQNSTSITSFKYGGTFTGSSTAFSFDTTNTAGGTDILFTLLNATTPIMNIYPSSTDGVSIRDGGGQSYVSLSTNNGTVMSYAGTSVSCAPGSISLYDGSTNLVQVTTAGLVPGGDNGTSLGTPAARWKDGYFGSSVYASAHLGFDGYIINGSGGATSGQVLKYNGTAFVPSTDSGYSQVQNNGSNVTQETTLNLSTRLVASDVSSKTFLDLATSGVSANSYAFANGSITFDAYGRATAATAASNIVILSPGSQQTGTINVSSTIEGDGGFIGPSHVGLPQVTIGSNGNTISIAASASAATTTSTNAGTGGAATIAGGAGGAGAAASTGSAGVGGAIVVTGGVGGVSGASGAVANAGGSATVRAGTGGAGNANNAGEVGGNTLITGGTGGAAGSGGSAAAGGTLTLSGGTGGAPAATNRVAGVGGAATLAGGAGVAGATGVTNGSAGGTLTVSGGAGGASNTTGTAGAGATVTIVGGAGGNGNTGIAGVGGAVSLSGGNAGTTSATGAAGGNVTIDGGTASGAAVAGTITIGGTNASAVAIGRTATNTTINGHLTGGGTQPTIAVGSAGTPPAGGQMGTSGATVAIAGCDTDGYVNIKVGVTPVAFAANTIYTFATITFSTAFGTAPKCIIIDEANAKAASAKTGTTGINFFVQRIDIATGTWKISMTSSGTPTLTASTEYWLYYLVVG